jgi:hypothetical protein
MLSSPRVPLLAASLALALALGSAACAAKHAPPPAPPPRPPVAEAPARPAVPPGHLARVDVDRVLTTQGPPWVLRRVISEEVMLANGKFSGWRLVGLPEEWRDIDIRPGDVVTRVNGLPIETPDQFWEAWKSVAGALELKISLMRDGAPRALVVPIDGAPSPETSRALGQSSGPQRAAAPPEVRSKRLGGGSGEPTDEEAY